MSTTRQQAAPPRSGDMRKQAVDDVAAFLNDGKPAFVVTADMIDHVA